MSAVGVFEWNFSPPDYFEGPIEIVRDDYTLTFTNGKAQRGWIPQLTRPTPQSAKAYTRG